MPHQRCFSTPTYATYTNSLWETSTPLFRLYPIYSLSESISQILTMSDLFVDIVDYLDHRPSPFRDLDFSSIYPPAVVSLSRLGMDVWRYHILLFCDLMSLLRLNWVNQNLRRLLNSAEFVVEYQTACWYLQPRYCRCARNLFYLDLTRFLDFTFEYRGLPGSASTPEVNTVHEVSMLLRQYGRTPDMLVQSFQRSGQPPTREPLPVKLLIPQDSHAFVYGFTQMWVDSCIIPMPRCIDHPVEQRRVTTGTHRLLNEQQETESVADFEHRMFWRDFHEVTDEMFDVVSRDVDLHRIIPEETPREHGFGNAEPDLVEEWMSHCQTVGADPFDPMYDDAECNGFRCIRWARAKMFDSAVGGTAYPLDLCLHREDLTRTASRLGTDYIDRMYVHLHRYQGGSAEWNMMDHRGVLYVMGTRYEHCNEDFVPWVLSTQALLHSVYAHTWLDSMSNWTRMLMAHLHHLATEVEEDMRFTVLQERWKLLQSLCFAGPAVMVHTRNYTERQRERDQSAIHLMFSSQYTEENRYIMSLVNHGNLWTNDGNLAQQSRHYLSSLLTQFDHSNADHRTESQRIKDAYRLIRLAEYITDFAEYVAPRVDERTVVTRRRAFKIYLSSFVSLTMFCPGWKRMYHWKPSKTHEQTSWQIPRINLQHNHRYQRYLNYCNRRTLYYHPDPSLLLNNARQDATYGWR